MALAPLNPPGSRIGVAVFATLALAIAGLVVFRETDRVESVAHQTRIGLESLSYTREVHWIVCLGLCAVATAVMIGRALRAGTALGPPTRVLSATLAVMLVLASGFAYFYAMRGIAGPFYPHLHDSFHYLLGPKYFDELGYFDFYGCVAAADSETHQHLRPTQKIRNLRDYGATTAAAAAEQAGCRERFGEPRWSEFKKDVETYAHAFWKTDYLATVLNDHGYNGTPFHTFVAGKLIRDGPETYARLNYYALVDVLGLCLLMAVVTWAFGWRIGFAFAIFFFLNFADRQYFIGGSYFRYVWMVTLGVGIALLQRRRHGWAGLFMSISALLNVFPVLFLAGVGLKGVISWLRDGQLAAPYRRFAVACALTLVIGAGLGMTHGRSFENYRDFASFIDRHADKLTYSRVGFRYAFLFRGEVTEESASYPYPYAAKAEELRKLRPVVWGLAGVILLAGLAVATRLDDVEATVLSGFSLFFLLFGTVEYYYAIMALLILLWHRRARAPTGAWFLALLFGLMTVIWIAWDRTGLLAFCNNTVTSVALLSYLLASITWLGFETGLWRDLRRWIAARFGRELPRRDRWPRLETCLIATALLVTPLGLGVSWAMFGAQWEYKWPGGSAEDRCAVLEVPEALRIEPRELGPLRLVGLFASPMNTRPVTVSVVTYWSLDESVEDDLLLAYRLASPAGEVGPANVRVPCEGRWPTSKWNAGKIYRDALALPLPPDVDVAELELTLGVRRGRMTIGEPWRTPLTGR